MKRKKINEVHFKAFTEYYDNIERENGLKN